MLLPWEESSTFIDSNGNLVPLGNFGGTLSLVLSIFGTVKGALEVFEPVNEKFKIFIFTAVNISFRITSYAYFIQFFGDWRYIGALFLTIIVVNAIFFLCRMKKVGRTVFRDVFIFCRTHD